MARSLSLAGPMILKTLRPVRNNREVFPAKKREREKEMINKMTLNLKIHFQLRSPRALTRLGNEMQLTASI